VHRYAVGAEAFDIYCRFKYIGGIATTAVSQRGDFIDIHRKPNHGANIAAPKTNKKKEPAK
jgi:hypothetical protein